ncbi:polysaccharide biosynthesis tyrosine autokinase [Agromyces sp. SYSU K20354]|uniref:polysaccharide biosynthesis tyrosine autokinase n=1 Tax=Agromyces cavernae TaxID=2898659 RepID=UPI001E61CEF0|nr:polysaccharide biosynthesis tyrosine autokinase [Agromyces cavernae]MCD2440998.1 polysaccharide biosynthesis tyrosine autokinase [Agromyces cavernae]
MSVARAVGVLRKRWYIVLAATILGGAGAFAASSTVTPIYHSTASLYFSLRTASSGSDINQGSAYTQAQMLSFAQLATSALVLDPAAAELDRGFSTIELRRMMSVTIPQNTVILDINVGTTDPERAALVANTVAASLVAAVNEVAPIDSDGAATVSARSIEPATPAIFQSAPNKQQDAFLGAVIGFLLSSVAVVLASALDTRVRSETALKAITELPLLGSIEQTPLSSDPRPVAIRQPNGSAAESFRQVRSGLRFASASHETRSLAITSSVPAEGKTWLAANLSFVLAETGKRVLLVDADLRKPRVADTFGLVGAVGLTTVLIDAIPLRSAVQAWPRSSLEILPSGAVPPNPAELLASERMKEIIQQLVDAYDLVVIDTAPVEAVADATMIAQQVDSVLIVADTRRVRRAQLASTIAVLERTGAHISGVVLNRVKARPRDSYYYVSDEPAKGPTSPRRGARVTSSAID